MTKGEFNRFCQVTEKRGFCWTLHDYTDAHLARIKEFQEQYTTGMVYNHEICPKSGRPHLQGFLQSKYVKTWPWMKEKLGIDTVHWELAENVKALTRYCQKSDSRDPAYPEPVILGRLPLNQEEKGAKGEEYYKRNRDAFNEGRFDDMDPSADINLLAKFEYSAAFHAKRKKLPNLETTVGAFQYHFGTQTGCGKTEFCEDQHGPNVYVWNPAAKWSMWRDNCDVVVFSDMDARNRPEMWELKTWCQKQPFNISWRYNSRTIRPRLLLFNTNEPFEKLFKGEDPVHLAALKRRLVFYEWKEPYFIDADETLGRNPNWVNPKTGETPPP